MPYCRQFGRAHSGVIRSELMVAGLDARRAKQVAREMNKLARMPFTNNWWVKLQDRFGNSWMPLADQNVIPHTKEQRTRSHCSHLRYGTYRGYKVTDLITALVEHPSCNLLQNLLNLKNHFAGEWGRPTVKMSSSILTASSAPRQSSQARGPLCWRTRCSTGGTM